MGAYNSKAKPDKSQGATEYLINYGWAILAIMGIGLGMYYLGIFNLQTASPRTSGFMKINPNEQKIFFTSDGYFTGVFTNQAGYVIDISEVTLSNINDKIECDKVSWSGDLTPGGQVIVTAENCVSGNHESGESYSLVMRINYSSDIGGVRIQRIEEGAIYGVYVKAYEVSFTCGDQGGFCCGTEFDTCKSGTRILASDCGICCRGETKINCDYIEIASSTTTTSTTSTTIASTTTTASATTTTTAMTTSTTMMATTTIAATTTTTVMQHPDLVITEVFGFSNTIYFMIENKGGSEAAVSYSSLFVDGTRENIESISAIPAGSATLESFWSYDWSCSGSSDTVRVCADIYNSVSESNEGNNCRTSTIFC